MLSIGETEVLILLMVVLLLFWARCIPELAKSIGSGVREFRRGVSDHDDSEPVKEREEREKLPEAQKTQTKIGDNTFAGRGAFYKAQCSASACRSCAHRASRPHNSVSHGRGREPTNSVPSDQMFRQMKRKTCQTVKDSFSR